MDEHVPRPHPKRVTSMWCPSRSQRPYLAVRDSKTALALLRIGGQDYRDQEFTVKAGVEGEARPGRADGASS
jgi:hypothetical protein